MRHTALRALRVAVLPSEASGWAPSPQQLVRHFSQLQLDKDTHVPNFLSVTFLIDFSLHAW
jgi:hypothetical protein